MRGCALAFSSTSRSGTVVRRLAISFLSIVVVRTISLLTLSDTLTMDEMDKDIAQADSALEEPTDPIYQMLEDIIEISSTQPSEALMRAQTLLKLDEWLELDALCLARIQESRAFSYYEFKEWNLAIAAAELALTFEAQAEPYDSQARIELKQMCREYATAVLNSCKGRLRETQPTASAEPAEPVQPGTSQQFCTLLLR